MEAVREVTDWSYNHTYLVDGNKVLAYIAQGTDRPQYFQRRAAWVGRLGKPS
jgi:hypothetical protein